MGEKKLRVQTQEGFLRDMTVQIANVRKPLLSVARLNDTGNSVVLGDQAYIKNKRTGEITMLKRVGRMFYLDLWIRNVRPPSKKTGFARQ